MRLFIVVLIHQETYSDMCSPNENKQEKKHAINSKNVSVFATNNKTFNVCFN